MTEGKLLKIDSALHRLRQLEQDRQSLSDLMQEVRQIQDRMASLQAEAEKKREDTERWLRILADIASDLSRLGEESRRKLEEVFSQLSALNEKQEKKTRETLGSIEQRADLFVIKNAARIDSMLAEGQKRLAEFTDAAKDVEERIERTLEPLKAEQSKGLDRLNQACECMGTIETTFAQMAKTVYASLDSIRQQQDLADKKIKAAFDSSQKELEAAISGTKEEWAVLLKDKLERLEKDRREVIADNQTLRGAVEKLQEKVAQLNSGIFAVRKEADEKESAYKRSVTRLGLLAILGILFGALSLATILFQWGIGAFSLAAILFKWGIAHFFR